jgi:hypothetical protein
MQPRLAFAHRLRAPFLGRRASSLVPRATLHPRLIDPRNRVALSREVMRALDVRVGDYVTFEVLADQVSLRKLVITVAQPKS